MRYTQISAESKIIRNGGKINEREITIAQPGIGVLGAIDYLIKQHNYKRK